MFNGVIICLKMLDDKPHMVFWFFEIGAGHVALQVQMFIGFYLNWIGDLVVIDICIFFELSICLLDIYIIHYIHIWSVLCWWDDLKNKECFECSNVVRKLQWHVGFETSQADGLKRMGLRIDVDTGDMRWYSKVGAQPDLCSQMPHGTNGIFTYMKDLFFLGFSCRYTCQSHGAYGLGILEDPALREVIVMCKEKPEICWNDQLET